LRKILQRCERYVLKEFKKGICGCMRAKMGSFVPDVMSTAIHGETCPLGLSYAPGKIILGGEHAVVYGHKALATSIDRGIRVIVRDAAAADYGNSRGPFFKANGLGFASTVMATGDYGPPILQKALNCLVDQFTGRIRSLEFVVESAVPGGSGLGSSAALSVAMVKALGRALDIPMELADVLKSAGELEKIFHGSPSGIDHTVVAHGGTICFRRGEPFPSVESVLQKQRLKFAVALTSPHGGTGQAVAALSVRRKRHPDIFDSTFQCIENIVQEMCLAVTQGHLSALGELMNLNQGHLNALGVSTPEIEMLCELARSKGALGAKLTGAGGGGAVIALIDGDPQGMVRAFESAGYTSFAALS
jgi:hydroxymethylglutaryl-CoA reductase